jgi:hypothetical protein
MQSSRMSNLPPVDLVFLRCGCLLGLPDVCSVIFLKKLEERGDMYHNAGGKWRHIMNATTELTANEHSV